MSKAILMTPGIDSLSTYILANDPAILPVYFDIKSKYSRAELTALHTLFMTGILKTETLTDNSINLEKMETKSAFVPYRNLMLILLASYYATDIIIGYVSGDNVSDNSIQAHKDFEQTLNKYGDGEKYQVLTPKDVIGLDYHPTKTDLIKLVIERKGRAFAQSLLDNSYSCYTGGIRECKKCAACFRKYVSGKVAGLEISFDNPELIEEYKIKMTQPNAVEIYGEARVRDTLTII